MVKNLRVFSDFLNKNIDSLFFIIGLFFLNYFGYKNNLLFHTIAELYTITIASAMFASFWVIRERIDDGFFSIISIGLLFVALADLLHTFSIPDLEIINSASHNQSLQFWISARFIQGLTFLIAPSFSQKKASNSIIFTFFSISITIIFLFIFNGYFPTMHSNGVGIIDNKRISEILIIILILGGIVHLFIKRNLIDNSVFLSLLIAMFLSFASESLIAIESRGHSNISLAGLNLKILSSFFLFRTVNVVGIKRPTEVIFSSLEESRRKLQESKQRYRQLLENSLDGIVSVDLEGKIIDFNIAYQKMLGYSNEELKSKSFWEFTPLKWREGETEILKKVMEHGFSGIYEKEYVRKNGEIFPVEVSAYLSQDPNSKPDGMWGFVRDITERKKAEETLRENYTLLNAVGQMANVGGWEVDAATRAVKWTEQTYRIHEVPVEYEPTQEEAINFFHPEDRSKLANAIDRALEFGEPYDLEVRFITAKGQMLWTHSVCFPQTIEGKTTKLIGTFQDITESKNAEVKIQRQLNEVMALHGIATAGSEAKSVDELIEATTQILANNLYSDNFGIITYDREKDELTNHPSYRGLGENAANWVGNKSIGITGRAVRTGEAQLVNDVSRDPDYLNVRLNTLSELAVPIKIGGEIFGIINSESSELDFFNDDDLELLTAFSNQLATAIEKIQLFEEQKQRAAELAALYETAVATSAALDSRTLYKILSEKILETFPLDHFLLARFHPSDQSISIEFALNEKRESREWAGKRFGKQESGLIGWVARENTPSLFGDLTEDNLLVKIHQVDKKIRSWLGVPLAARGRVIGAMSVQAYQPEAFSENHQRLLESIAAQVAVALDNTDLLEQSQKQIDQLETLHDIDMVISSSMDLRVTLNIILDQATAKLGVDAAAVLLVNEKNGMLEYAAGHGFRTRSIQDYRLRIGESAARKAAIGQHIVQAFNLDEDDNNPAYTQLLEQEDFKSYYSVPLTTKGKIRGMLDIFHREPLSPDSDWFSFLETIAGQAAIAIDNDMLLENLQQRNVELRQAYDSTLEGWSRALDLRDKETEGHTQRVTYLTLRIAKEVGVSDEELDHILRGALLHDIGKMGIPDSILLKPGPLTEEDWESMRKHPVYAYDLLYPIQYLRPALEIPYCHHEKWDGSGYPRGLKGEEIPLAARIFAVVDVWDALTSDRPYRDAWTEKKAVDYIRNQRGKHFDPEITDLFLDKIKGELLKNLE